MTVRAAKRILCELPGRFPAGFALPLLIPSGVSFTPAGTRLLRGVGIGLVCALLLVAVLLRISRRARGHDRALALDEHDAVPRAIRHAVLVLVPRVHRGVLPAIVYAKTISPRAEAVFVELDAAETPRLQEEWNDLDTGLPLTVLKSPWRSLAEPIIRYTRTLRAERHVDLVTVIIPEFVVAHWWHGVLHNQAGLMLKLALMFEPGVVVTNVRFRPDRENGGV